MTEPIPHSVAGGVILSADRRILLGLKKPESTGVYKGLWIFPGGVFDDGEDPLESFLDEFEDETNLDRSILDPEPVVFDPPLTDRAEAVLADGSVRVYNMTMFIFRCLLPEGHRHYKVQPGDELELVVWWPVRDLDYLRKPPPSHVVLGRLGLIRL